MGAFSDILTAELSKDDAASQPATAAEAVGADAMPADAAADDFTLPEFTPLPGLDFPQKTTARAVLHGEPGLLKPQQISEYDALSRKTGIPFGVVSIDPQDARSESMALAAEKIPGADAWTTLDPQNAALLGAYPQAFGKLQENLAALTLGGKPKQADVDEIEEVAVPEAFSGELAHLNENVEAMEDADRSKEGIRGVGTGISLAWNRGELQRVRGNLGIELAMMSLFGGGSEERKQEILRNLDTIDYYLQKDQEQGGSSQGLSSLNSAVEQLPRMMKEDFFAWLKGAAYGGAAGSVIGATVGGTAGTVVPVAGTAAGAAGGAALGFGKGVFWGGALGAYGAASSMEAGNVMADLRNLKDDAGRDVPLDESAKYALGYGAASGLVEVGSEYAVLKILGIAGGLKKLLPSGVSARSAIAAAMADKSLGKVIAKGGARLLGSTAIEGGEETVQTGLEILAKDLLRINLSSNGDYYFANRDITVFDPEHAEEYWQSFSMGASAGFWLGLLPSAIHLGGQMVQVKNAKQYAAAHQQAAQSIDENLRQAAQLSPERTETFLETAAGMDQLVHLPADAVMELRQDGVDILGPMGWEEADVQEAANQGSELVVPVARLHARLDPSAMGRVSEIMRPEDAQYSSQEADFVQEVLDQDVLQLVEDVERHEDEMTAFDKEVARLRSEFETIARQRTPLNASIRSSQDTETSIASYVNDNLAYLVSAARSLSRRKDDGTYDMDKAAEFLSRVDTGFQERTEEELMLDETARAQEDADVEFWQDVWGRVDPDKFRETYGHDSYRDMVARYGRGIFSRRGRGVGIDEIADERKRQGRLLEDADSDTFLEELNGKEAPSSRVRRRVNTSRRSVLRQEQTATTESSMEAVRRQYEGTDKWMRAPNGQQTHLSERQWLQVRTPEFKAWFGDWENDPANASKVVDENGEPMVVYHGSPIEDLEVFLNQSEIEGNDRGFRGTGSAGLYFSPRRGYAERYTAANLAAGTQGGRVYELFLNIRNPATAQEAGLSRVDQISQEQAQEIQGKGIDGIMHEHKKRPEYIVFDSRQVKSATDNVGTFDATNPNSLFQMPGIPESSMEAVRKQYEGTDQWMKAPNGKPTNLNERQWLQVRTPEFKAWFGDWEGDPKHASRVVDKNGEPLVVYHGTAAEVAFSVFGTGEANQTAGWKLDREAFFFTDKPINADSYAARQSDFQGNPIYNDNAKVYPCFLNLRKPLSVSAKGSSWNDIYYKDDTWTTNDLANLANEQGKDGVIVKNVWDYGPGAISSTAAKGTTFIVFAPTNIKSATANVGTFDPNNPNILFQRAFHGSPYRFAKFMLQHIGAGEGGQAHGWGLYFAQKRDVSEDYLNMLAPHRTEKIVRINGVPYTYAEGKGAINFETEEKVSDYSIVRILHDAWNAKSVEDVIDNIVYELDNKKNMPRIMKEQYEKMLELLGNTSVETVNKTRGQLYEVEIPDNDVLLDEQKTFEEQPEAVQKAVRQLWEKIGVEGPVEGLTGWDIYDKLAAALGDDPKASEALNAAGVKGITYESERDGRCFVVFDDKSIELINTFYQMMGEQGAAALDRAQEVTTRMDNLGVARGMEQEGKDAKAIKLATGWERGADGLWRYEIMDGVFDSEKAYKRWNENKNWHLRKIKEAKEERRVAHENKSEDFEFWDQEYKARVQEYIKVIGRSHTSTTLGDIYDAPELYAAYPQLKDMPVYVEILDSGIQAEYRPWSFYIALSPGADKGTLLHEIQHAIQEIEGFAEGGNPEQFRMDTENFQRARQDTWALLDDAKRAAGLDEFINQSVQDMRDGKKTLEQHWKDLEAFKANIAPEIAEDIARYEQSMKQLVAEFEEKFGSARTPEEIYTRLMGEVESRNVERRMNMTEEERRGSLASETEDVPRDRQIILRDGQGASASLDLSDVAAEDQAFLQGNAMPRGATQIGQDGSYYVTLFRGADLSTLTHEIGHVVFKEFQRLIQSGEATEAMQQDWAALEEWLSQLDDEAVLAREYANHQTGYFGGRAFADLDDFEKAIVKERARQEWLARGLEQYLREGRAPTPRTEGMFRRFAKWLARVYRTAMQLDIQLTDEVRGVFDRLIESQEDIDAAARERSVEDASAELLDALGLRGADRVALQGLIQEDRDRAADALRRQRQAAIARNGRAWRERAERELLDDPIYAARGEMRRTPINWDDIADAYGEDMARELAQKLPGSISHDAGRTVNAEMLAVTHGFRDAGAMIQAILQAPGKAEKIRELVAGYREELEADLDAEEYLFSQEGLAEQQEKIGEAVYRMEAAGRTMGGKPVRGRSPRQRKAIAKKTLQRIAANILAKKKASEAVSPYSYRRQAARYMRLEKEAILKKDWAKAIEYNEKARINLGLEKQSRANRDAITGLIKSAQRFLNSKRTDPLARWGVYRIAQRLGLFDTTRRQDDNAADKTIDDWHSWTDEMRDQGFYTADAQIDDAILTGPEQPWRELTWEDLTRSMEAALVTMHIERMSRATEEQTRKAEWKTWTEGIAASIRANIKHREPGVWDQKNGLVRLLQSIDAAHMQADTIALALDDDQDFGPAWNAIVRPIREATWKRTERLKAEGEKVKQLFSVYSRKEKIEMRRKKYRIPGMGVSMTKEQMLGVLLNCGNASNKQRLMDGQHMTEENIAEVLSMLDERDFKFAQSVWDYLETFRKESFDLEEKITGVRPRAIEATPLVTPYGTFRGGYFPVKYDTSKSSRAIDTESIGTLTGSMMPAVDHGSMMQRTANGLGAPLLLALDAIPDHVTQIVHNLCFREPVRQVARVLNTPVIDQSISETLGKPYTDALKSWLHYVAGERPGTGMGGKILRWARKNLALMTMGFSLATGLAQTTGLLATISEIGGKWTALGVARAYGRGPIAGFQFAMQNSAMMRNRINNTDRDVFEFSSRVLSLGSRNRMIAPLAAVQDFMQKNGFKLMGWMQMVFCDLPTWHAAYAKMMEESGGDHAKACEYADIVVERTQVGGADYNLAAVQHGGKQGELVKLLTPFYSYFGALYQLFARRTRQALEHRTAAATGRLATLALLTWTIEPTLMAILMGDRPDDDDDEGWLHFLLRKAAWESFWSPFNMVVGVRDVAGAIRSSFDGYGGRYRPVAAAAVIESITKAIEKDAAWIADEGEGKGKKAAIESLRAVGFTTGLINNQELRILLTFWDWLDGTNPDLELMSIIRKQKR